MSTPEAGVTIAVAVSAGVFAQCAARRLRVPGIVLLLGLGVVLGPELLGWVRPHDLGPALFWIVDLAVAVVLFEGGLSLELSRLRRQEVAIRWLVTVGALVTLAGGMVAARLWMGWSWPISALFGSLVVVTGPTVVGPLVRDMRLKPRLKTVLEAEGVLIDPVGAFLAALVLQIALVPAAATWATEFQSLFLRLAIGLGAGFGGGFVLGSILRRGWIPHGMENIFMLGGVMALYQVCELGPSHTGILAITVAGAVMGNLGLDEARELREFKDQLTILLVGMLFILLAADVPLSGVVALGWPGVGVVATLILLVRPLTVWVSTRRSTLDRKDKIFVASVAPRGIVAAAVASLTAVALQPSDGVENAIGDGVELRALVFLTIAVTVVLAGTTAKPLATYLGLRLPGRSRYALLGAQGLGLALGELLRDAGRSVVFLDSDPTRCNQAKDSGFSVVFGDALEERTLQRAQFESVGTAVGVTPNDHLNTLFVQHAHEYFQVPAGMVAVRSLEKDVTPAHVQRAKAAVLFDGPHDTARWDVRYRHGDLVVDRFQRVPEPESTEEPLAEAAADAPNPENVKEPAAASAAAPAERPVQPTKLTHGESFVVLAYERDGELEPMTMNVMVSEPEAEDLWHVALYAPEREAGLEKLLSLGWEPVPLRLGGDAEAAPEA